MNLPTVRVIKSIVFHKLTTASSGQLGGATSSDGDWLYGTDGDASMYNSSNVSNVSLISVSSNASMNSNSSVTHMAVGKPLVYFHILNLS